MNPAKFAQMMKYLTRVKEQKPKLPDVFPASELSIPTKTKNVEEIEAINRFVRDNPRQDMAGGGMLVQPGFGGTRQGYKKDKLTIKPPKTLTGMAGDRKLTADQIASLNPDFKGNLIDKKTKKVIGKIYTRELNDAFEVLNVIKKNKGHAASIEEIGRLAGFVQPAGGKTAGKVNFKRTNLALKLAVDQFDELENFKLASEKYPKINKKKFRYLDMVAKSFANYSITTNPTEAAAHLLPENMAMIYDLGGREDVTKDVFNVRGKLNANDKKFLIDRISVLTGKNFNTEELNNLIEKTTEVRTAEGRIATRIKLNANMNKQIKDIANDSTIKNLLKGDLNRKTQAALLKRATEIVGGDASIASRRLFQMAEAMSDTTNQYKDLGIKINNNIANKIIATGKQIGGRNNRYGMSSVLYDYYGNIVDKALGATEGKTFIGKYQQAIRNALDKGQSPDEIFSLTASARRELSPYAIFTQQLRTDVNSAIKGAYIDSALSRTHEKLQKIFQGRKYSQLNAADKKAANALVEAFEKEKIRALNQPINPGAVREGAKPIYLTAAEKKNIQLPSFDLKNPPSKAIANYKDFDKNLQNAFDISYEKVGYSMKVPKEFLTQKQLLAKIGCPGFKAADGGRATFDVGTNCQIKGANLINSGMKNASPAQLKNFAAFANRAASLGRGVMKFGVIPEALYVAADSAIRLGMGDNFNEAFLRATEYLRPGDQTKQAEMLEADRFFGPEIAGIIGRSIDYKNELTKVQSLEDQKANLENLSGGDKFDYIGDLSQDVKNVDAQLKQATDNLNNKFKITDAERIYAERMQEEIDDARGAGSFFTKVKSKFRDAGQDLDDIETLGAPELSQQQLNQRMLPQAPTIYKLKDGKFITKNLSESSFDEIQDHVRLLKSVGAPVDSSKNLLEQRDYLRSMPLSEQEQIFGKEATYGFSGTMGEPINKPVFQRPQNVIGDMEKEIVGQTNVVNPFDIDISDIGSGLRGFAAAGGGIAKEAGDRSGPPPEKGPMSQGLQGLMKRVRNL